MKICDTKTLSMKQENTNLIFLHVFVCVRDEGNDTCVPQHTYGGHWTTLRDSVLSFPCGSQ